MDLLPSRCCNRLLLLLLPLLDLTWGQVLSAPGLTKPAIHIPGEIYIGALISITGKEEYTWNGRCQDDISGNLEYIEANQLLVEMTDAVNANSSILNGIKLGLTSYDFCVRDMFALAESIHFLPTGQPNENRYVAVICCDTSSTTVVVSPLMTAYEMPIISYDAGSDKLSNKAIHEYFLRTVAPSHFDIETIIGIIRRYKWPYIAVLSLDGEYGDSMMNLFMEMLQELQFTVCIGYSYQVKQSSTDDPMPEVLDHLLNETDLTVVVLLVWDINAMQLFAELKKRDVTDRFVWLATSGWSLNLNGIPSELYPYGTGALTLMTSPPPLSNEYKFLRDPAFAIDPRNPRMIAYWEIRLNCKWNVTCNESSVVTNKPPPLGQWHAQVYDAYTVLVKALEKYLPRIDYNMTKFSSNDYLWTMKNLSFDGKMGRVQFDSKGDLLTNINIQMGVHDGNGYKVVDIGYWNAADKKLYIDENKIWWYGRRNATLPESVCSRECLTGFIRLPMKLVCCWHCFSCRNNEITNDNASVCIGCPTFTWPDETRLQCIPITPTFVRYYEDLGITLIALASIGIVVVVGIGAIYIRNNDSRLIRASCRESSYIMLVGIAINFTLLILMVVSPTNPICLALRYGLHLSCTMIYGPIIIKIIKIFRIFMSRSTQPPKFIDASKQVIIIVALICVEAVIVTGSIFLHFPSAERFMASPNDPVVEMTCSESAASMGIGLAFNALLILCCAALAFVSRKLPDNYNESSQVAFSVLTVIILWIVFVPSWLTSASAHRKTLMISLALVLNGIINLVGLFIPKVYALYFAGEAQHPPGKPRFVHASASTPAVTASSSETATKPTVDLART